LVISCAVVLLAGAGCAVGVRQPATDITDTIATLNGKVLSTTGGPGSWYFEYGPTPARTERTPVRSIDFEVNKSEPVSEPVSGLEPGTTYHFAVCAEDSENPGEPFCSPDQTFASLAVEDSATGMGSSRDFTFDFAATSGPSGENPDGTFSGEYLDFHLEGPVICLNVEGNVATLVFTHDTPNFGRWAVVTVVDNGPDGQDTIAPTTYNIPKDCSTRETTLEQPLTDGDIAVSDAQPQTGAN